MEVFMKRDYKEILNSYQGGDLDLSGCEIKSLELGHIEGNLNLSKCVIGKMSIGWVSNELNMSGAQIDKIVSPIDARFVNMSSAKIGKLPEHIWTDSLNMEKCVIEKFNTDIKANVFNIKGTKFTTLPKNFSVHRIIVDSKSAKFLPLSTIKQCEELMFDETMFCEQRGFSADFSNFVSEVSEVATV